MFEAIIKDADALSALDAFSTHSYNMCVVKPIQDMVAGLGKDYWQTEASANGPEGYHDSVKAITGVARCVSDINLGTNIWIWFIGWAGRDPNDNATRIIGWDNTDGSWRPFLKFYYFRALSRTYDVGGGIRQCVSDMDRTPDDGNEDRGYKYMENWYGQKPPICAGAIKNPNGEWGFTVCNQTGIFTDWAGSTYEPADVYEIKFVVEELAGQSGQKLKVMRTNDSKINIIEQDVTLEDGKFTVVTNPMDIVCIRASFHEEEYPYMEIPTYKIPDDYGPCGMGFGVAFIPAIGIGANSLIRRRRRNRRKNINS
jgi:hypothetical protein